ncbi:unnamed protein product [Protopolystoma xenopodis]|uniref:PDEase domain-containing protein n=1 Tax=Protopolystoma xenopodis TaxID=117903 RepID=A0A448XAS3_9PLAT|nr:unnamed protein product [Protopolystoma xenopodis]
MKNEHASKQALALKCADISNPCRKWEVYVSWVALVTEEFFRQGDREREYNLPIAPTMDRYATTKPKIQIGKFLFDR